MMSQSLVLAKKPHIVIGKTTLLNIQLYRKTFVYELIQTFFFTTLYLVLASLLNIQSLKTKKIPKPKVAAVK